MGFFHYRKHRTTSSSPAQCQLTQLFVIVLAFLTLYIVQVVWPLLSLQPDWDYLRPTSMRVSCSQQVWTMIKHEMQVHGGQTVVELTSVRNLHCLQEAIRKNSAKSDLLINDKRCFSNTTNRESRKLIFNFVRNFTNYLHFHKIKFFMTRGTLLGSYRHMTMVPWDNDFDIMISDSQEEAAYAALKNYEKLRKDSEFRDNKGVNRHWRLWTSINDWAIDIFHYRDTHGKYLYLRDLPFVALRADVFPLSWRPLQDMWLPAPGNPRQYLQRYYGTPLTRCVTQSWNEEQAATCTIRDVSCDRLSHRYPFVRRLSSDLGVLEVLAMNNGSIIRSVFYPRQTSQSQNLP